MTSQHALDGPVSPLLNPRTVQQILGISASTLDRYVLSGRLTPVRLPTGHRRFHADQVQSLLRGVGDPR